MGLEAVDLRVRLGGREVLQGASLRLEEGRVVAVTGPSGAGKSTLLLALLGLVPLAGGGVFLEGKPLNRRRQGRLVAYVPQHPEASFNPRWTLGQSLQEPLRLLRLPLEDPEAHLEGLCLRLGVAPRWLSRFPHQLSGGELQRAALVRALVASPRFLLADEPTAMLDPLLAASTARTLAQEAQAGRGILFTTHDLALAREVAHEAWELEKSRLRRLF